VGRPMQPSWHARNRFGIAAALRLCAELRRALCPRAGEATCRSYYGENASDHHFLEHSADFSVQDEIRPAIHVGRFAINNGKLGTIRLCDHR
jgi:hypothetical protein